MMLLNAGEGPFLAPKKLGVDQGRRDGPEVHRHESAARPQALVMDEAREEGLAGAGFAQKQHRQIGFCGMFHKAAKLLRLSARP